VTNSYMALGGDGYSAFKDHLDMYDSSAMQRDVLIDYINFIGGQVNYQVQERVLQR